MTEPSPPDQPTDPTSLRPDDSDATQTDVSSGRRRRTRWLVAGIAAGAVALIVVTAAVTIALTRAGQSTSAEPPPTTAATPPPVTTTTPPVTPTAQPEATRTTHPAVRLDERTTCNLLIPQLTSGVDVVNALNDQPSGSTVNRAKLDDTVRNLHAIQDTAPPDMVAEIGQQITTLEEIQSVFATGTNRTIEYDAFKTAGISLAIRCRPYATG
jgi:hypothetical protein